MLRSLLGFAIFLVLAAGAVTLAYPNAWFALHLYLEPAPVALPVPVAGVALRQVHDSWGSPRSGGRRHEGIDIFAPRGRPVLASTHGMVWRTGRDRLGGNVVLVLGPGRQLHYYAHLDAPADVRPGQRVEAGTVLGHVGDTGDARGGPTHLHYGIYRLGGKAIDPYPLLVAGGNLPAPANRAREPQNSSLSPGFIG